MSEFCQKKIGSVIGDQMATKCEQSFLTYVLMLAHSALEASIFWMNTSLAAKGALSNTNIRVWIYTTFIMILGPHEVIFGSNIKGSTARKW